MKTVQHKQISAPTVDNVRFFCHVRGYELPIIVLKVDGSIHVSYNGSQLQQWSLGSGSNNVSLHLAEDVAAANSFTAALTVIGTVLSNRQDLPQIILKADSALLKQLEIAGVLVPELSSNDSTSAGGVVIASTFWQLSALWLQHEGAENFPLHYVISNGRRHPRRAPKPAGPVYSRHIPWLDKILSFHIVDIGRDLLTINQWMNSPSVAEFYQEAGDLDYHVSYLQKQLDDPHTLPLIGFFDGVPFGYFEVYWAKEDRVSPFYDVDDFDRGWHMLVGDDNFRGKPWFTAWCSSIIHFMFLDDCRTQRIVCEPRHDHPKLIRNLDQFGFARLKEFDFPHKRSMLLLLLRERFFDERMTTRFVNSNFQTD